MDQIKYLSQSMKNPRKSDISSGLPLPNQMNIPLTVKVNLDQSNQRQQNKNLSQSPQKGFNFFDIFKISETTHNDTNNLKDQDNSQKLGLLSKIKKKKYFYYAIILLATIFAISLMIWLIVYLTSKDKKPTQTNNQNNQNDTDPVDFCTQNRQLCRNLNQQVKEYIQKNFTDVNEQRSLIQLSRSLRLLENQQNLTLSRTDYLKISRNLTASIECLMFSITNYPQVFQKMVELHIDNELEFKKYLNMTTAFNDEIYSMKSVEEWSISCELHSGERRLLESEKRQVTDESDCTEYETIVYITGFSSPISVLRNLNKLNQTITSNMNSGLTSRIIAIGGYQLQSTGSDNVFEFNALKFIYQQSRRDIIHSTNQTIIQTNIQKAFMRVVNGYYSLEGLDSITSEIFGKMQLFMEIFFNYAFTKSMSSYDIERHVTLVHQLIREGRRVIFFAHGFGSIYAAAIYQSLPKYNTTSLRMPPYKDAIAMVFVAPYVSKLPNTDKCSYITIPNDEVVAALRKINSKTQIKIPLEANQFAKEFTDLSMNHSLIGYLDNLKNKISGMVLSAKGKAMEVISPNNLGQGLINIELMSRNNNYFSASLTLKITQPDGSVVEPLKNKSSNGQLDFKQRGAQLQSHYYSKCTIEEGNYTVWVTLNGVNDTARISSYVSIIAGDQVYVNRIDVVKAITGTAPVFVCDLKVTLDEVTEKYHIDIDQDGDNYM